VPGDSARARLPAGAGWRSRRGAGRAWRQSRRPASAASGRRGIAGSRRAAAGGPSGVVRRPRTDRPLAVYVRHQARLQARGQGGDSRRGRRGRRRPGSRSITGSGYATRARVLSGMQRESLSRRRSIRCGVTRSPRQTRSADDDASHEPGGGADALRLSLLCLCYIARHKLALRGTGGHGTDDNGRPRLWPGTARQHEQTPRRMRACKWWRVRDSWSATAKSSGAAIPMASRDCPEGRR
jgi:hypothetical protein